MRLDDLANAHSVQMLRQGLAWWLGELRAMVPRRWLARGDAATVLVLSRTGAQLLIRNRRGRPLEPIALPDGADAATPAANGEAARAWERARAALRKRPGRVVVRLDPSLLLETSTTLPLAAQRSLRAILHHQLDRLLPLPGDDVVFDYTVTGRSLDAKTMTVRLLVTTPASIARALELARALGVTPRRIVADWPRQAGRTSQGEENRPVTFWHVNRSPGTRRQRWLMRSLEALIVLLLIGAYGLYVHKLDTARKDLRQEVAQATKTALKARSLSEEIAQSEATLAVLDGHDQQMVPLHLIDELTRLLPDSAWVTQLSVRGSAVEIIGYARRVSDLIRLIEQSGSFGNAHLRAPIIPAPDGDGERFDVGFNLGLKSGP